jgi:outer membrane lipoprotein LolB
VSLRGRLVSPVVSLAAFTAALLMSACALAPPLAALDGQTLTGRLAVRIDASEATPARAVSATFELQGTPTAGRLNLSTPLGSVLAQARWSPGNVVLATPQGGTRFADLDALTREVLGESLPVAALFDWLNGRPWPGAASVANVAPAGAGFEQLGWVVDLAGFDQASVTARRERPPVVTVRVKVDRP